MLPQLIVHARRVKPSPSSQVCRCFARTNAWTRIGMCAHFTEAIYRQCPLLQNPLAYVPLAAPERTTTSALLYIHEKESDFDYSVIDEYQSRLLSAHSPEIIRTC